MAVSVYSGTVTNGTPQSGLVEAIPAAAKSLGVTLLAQYSATAGTTGVKLQVGVSIDGGLTYSDYADVVTAAPTASQGSAQQSEAFASLDTYKNATHLQFKLLNLDPSNVATVALTFRAAA